MDIQMVAETKELDVILNEPTESNDNSKKSKISNNIEEAKNLQLLERDTINTSADCGPQHSMYIELNDADIADAISCIFDSDVEMDLLGGEEDNDEDKKEEVIKDEKPFQQPQQEQLKEEFAFQSRESERRERNSSCDTTLESSSLSSASATPPSASMSSGETATTEIAQATPSAPPTAATTTPSTLTPVASDQSFPSSETAAAADDTTAQLTDQLSYMSFYNTDETTPLVVIKEAKLNPGAMLPEEKRTKFSTECTVAMEVNTEHKVTSFAIKFKMLI